MGGLSNVHIYIKKKKIEFYELAEEAAKLFMQM